MRFDRWKAIQLVTAIAAATAWSNASSRLDAERQAAEASAMPIPAYSDDGARSITPSRASLLLISTLRE